MYHQSGCVGARSLWTPVFTNVAHGGGVTACRVRSSSARRGSITEAGRSRGWVMRRRPTGPAYISVPNHRRREGAGVGHVKSFGSNVSGLLLSGGESVRFGGNPKALLEIHGTPALLRMARLLSEEDVAPLAIVVPRGLPRWRRSLMRSPL